MNIQYHFSGNGIPVIEPAGSNGSLAGTHSDEFIEKIIVLSEEKNNGIAFDFTGKEYLNSSGLGELLKIHDRLHEKGLSVILIGVEGKISALFDVTGIGHFFKLVEKEDELNQG